MTLCLLGQLKTPLRNRRRRRAVESAGHSSCSCRAAAPPEEGTEEWEQWLAAPRLEAGLDVHRRLHAAAGRHAAYLYQWRAFCERQQRDWQSAHSDSDEGDLAGALSWPLCRRWRCLRGSVAQSSTSSARRACESSRRTRGKGVSPAGPSAACTRPRAFRRWTRAFERRAWQSSVGSACSGGDGGEKDPTSRGLCCARASAASSACASSSSSICGGRRSEREARGDQQPSATHRIQPAFSEQGSTRRFRFTESARRGCKGGRASRGGKAGDVCCSCLQAARTSSAAVAGSATPRQSA